MVDHSLETGWDKEVGGFYDGGYYFEGEDEITTVNDKKNWWAQAEGLNTLLIMAEKFPEDETNYRKYFNELWSYTKTYMIDQEQGGWYEWGIDKTPDAKMALKGHIWKATYHNYRALSHVADRLREMR
jgi:mannobiose 2-epimerase